MLFSTKVGGLVYHHMIFYVVNIIVRVAYYKRMGMLACITEFLVFLHQYMYWYIGNIINLTKLFNLHNVSDGEKSMESKLSSQNIKTC